MEPVPEPERDYDEILPGFFLGSSRFTDATLRALGVDAVVNMTPPDEVPEVPEYSGSGLFYRFPMSFTVPDAVVEENVRAAVRTVCNLLENAAIVYLHCLEGNNRSAAVAVGVVHRLLNLPMDEALAFVGRKRRIFPQARHLRAAEGVRPLTTRAAAWQAP